MAVKSRVEQIGFKMLLTVFKVWDERMVEGSEFQSLLPTYLLRCLQCFDTVGWVAGRAYSL